MVSNEYQALGNVAALFLPWMKWDGQMNAATAFTRMMLSAVPGFSGGNQSAALLALFEKSAIDAYYDDFNRFGEKEHIRTHYGEARAQALFQSDEKMGSMTMALIEQLKQSVGEEGIKKIKEQMEAMGQGELTYLYD